MLYKKVLITTLFVTQLNSSPCKEPATAYLETEFRYGCFCGRDFPNIEHSSKKGYKELMPLERKELIMQYQEIDPYDDIDKLCKEHDICYIKEGKEAKICNSTIYSKLRKIERKFRNAQEDNVSNLQCKNLAYDIGSVFHTIFSPADDEDTILDVGMLMFNGAITVMNKIFQESVDSLDNTSRYPVAKQKCFVKSLQQNE